MVGRRRRKQKPKLSATARYLHFRTLISSRFQWSYFVVPWNLGGHGVNRPIVGVREQRQWSVAEVRPTPNVVSLGLPSFYLQSSDRDISTPQQPLHRSQLITDRCQLLPFQFSPAPFPFKFMVTGNISSHLTTGVHPHTWPYNTLITAILYHLSL